MNDSTIPGPESVPKLFAEIVRHHAETRMRTPQVSCYRGTLAEFVQRVGMEVVPYQLAPEWPRIPSLTALGLEVVELPCLVLLGDRQPLGLLAERYGSFDAAGTMIRATMKPGDLLLLTLPPLR